MIAHTEKFVFFDTPQYIRKGWINRNRILNCNNEPLYVTVPIHKAERNTPIRDIVINQNIPWKEKIYGQLTRYKGKAPYYAQTLEVVKEVLETKTDFLSELSIKSVTQVSEYLNIGGNFDVYAQMGLDDITVQSPDEWALNITKKLGYDTYINPIGGMSFFDAQKYEDAGISLYFLKQELDFYPQFLGMEHFSEGLSIIDVMMFCKPQEIKDMMRHYELLKKG